MIAGAGAALLCGLAVALIAPQAFNLRVAALLLVAGAAGGAVFDIRVSFDPNLLLGHAAWQLLTCLALHFGSADSIDIIRRFLPRPERPGLNSGRQLRCLIRITTIGRGRSRCVGTVLMWRGDKGVVTAGGSALRLRHQSLAGQRRARGEHDGRPRDRGRQAHRPHAGERCGPREGEARCDDRRRRQSRAGDPCGRRQGRRDRLRRLLPHRACS